MRNDRIGDLVLTLPAMQAVRRQWPKAHVAALVSRYAGPLLAGSPYVDQVLARQSRGDRRRTGRAIGGDGVRRRAGL